MDLARAGIIVTILVHFVIVVPFFGGLLYAARVGGPGAQDDDLEELQELEQIEELEAHPPSVAALCRRLLGGRGP